MAHKVNIGQMTAPRHGALLLDQLIEIPDSLVRIENGDRWLAGVYFDQTPCGNTLHLDGTGDACDDELVMDDDVRRIPCDPSQFIQQQPFRVYDAFRTTALTDKVVDLDGLLDYQWQSWLSFALAQELVTGAASGTAGLSSAAQAPAGLAFGTETPIWNALAVLEAHLALTMGNRQGWLHVTPGLLAQAVQTYGLTRDGGSWMTPLGNKVVTDAGYFAAAPPTGESAAAAGQDWIYASGPVHYKLRAPDQLAGVLLATNATTIYRQGFGVLAFDPCPVSAALTSYDVNGAL